MRRYFVFASLILVTTASVSRVYEANASTARSVATISQVSHLATGDSHTCALLHNGVVRCWGDNTYGQLGINALLSSATPVNVSSFDDGQFAVSIAAGKSHTCALLNSGAIACWGDNGFGSLGNQSFMDSWSPMTVFNSDGRFVSVAAGGFTTCAIDVASDLWCWGSNSFGQVGVNSTETSFSTPQLVHGQDGAHSFVSVEVGANHVCAVSDIGTTWCWGANASSQRGDGGSSVARVPTQTSSLGTSITARQVSSGDLHTCAMLNTAHVKCWGSNTSGRLGDGTTTLRSAPTSVVNLTSATAISAGASHTCAISGGVSYCWGSNNNGRLGIDSTTASHVPTQVLLPTGVHTREISAGAAHTCVLLDTADVMCWGDNQSGQLGDGGIDEQYVPTMVAQLRTGPGISSDSSSEETHESVRITTSFDSVDRTGHRMLVYGTDEFLNGHNTVVDLGHFGPVQHIATGSHHSCVVIAGGYVKCWGTNDDGAIGDGSNDVRPLPVDVVGLGVTARKVAVGAGHSCVVLSDGALQCWGNNESGQVGDGTVLSRRVPTAVPVSNVIDVVLGDDFTCALTTLGKVFCWGNNESGQLATVMPSSSTPVEVEVDVDYSVLAIAAGPDQVCVVLNNAAVKCWGGGATLPTAPVGLGSSVSGVSVATNHVCAVLHSGQVKCWGDNTYGQLGDNTTTSSTQPVTSLFENTEHVKFVSTAHNTSCAVLTTGIMKCWGQGMNAVTGLAPDVGDLHTPTTVTALSGRGIRDVSLGELHGCALTYLGDVWCWGSNARQQRGIRGAELVAPTLLDVFRSATVTSDLVTLESDTSYFYRIDTTHVGGTTHGQISTFNTLQQPVGVPDEQLIPAPDPELPELPIDEQSPVLGDPQNSPSASQPSVNTATPSRGDSTNLTASPTRRSQRPSVKAGSWTPVAKVLKALDYQIPRKSSRTKLWVTVLDKRVCRLYSGRLWAIRQGTCRLMVLTMYPNRRLTMTPKNVRVSK